MKANKKYKDSVFTLYFNDKEKLIDIYNAVNKTNYPKDTKIEINTLEDVLFQDRANDISFEIDGKFVVLLEHQSTINENMPLRCLIYVARLYEKMIDSDAIYRKKLIKIPTPEFIVFYNGIQEFPKERTLKLSDAFIEDKQPWNLELTVKVININYDKSAQILEDCKSIREYSYFVKLVRDYSEQGYDLDHSLAKAVVECKRQGIMREFLEANGSEVENMLFQEFDLDKAIEISKEEAREDGLAEGRADSIRKLVSNSLRKGKTIEEIADFFDMDISEVKKIVESIE